MWKPSKRSYANSADPDQVPHNATSDQCLHCLLTGQKVQNRPDTPKITNGLVQCIVEESTSIQWVKVVF